MNKVKEIHAFVNNRGKKEELILTLNPDAFQLMKTPVREVQRPVKGKDGTETIETVTEGFCLPAAETDKWHYNYHMLVINMPPLEITEETYNNLIEETTL